MAGLSLATRLADEFGVTMSEAQKFVDDVGADLAKNLADEAGQGTKLVGDWWKPAAGATAAAGGGVLAWRQQEIEKMKTNARQQQNAIEAARMLAKSDMRPKTKQQVARALYNQAANPGGGGGNKKNKKNGGLLGGLFGGDAQTTLILIVVVAITLKYTLAGGGEE